MSEEGVARKEGPGWRGGGSGKEGGPEWREWHARRDQRVEE